MEPEKYPVEMRKGDDVRVAVDAAHYHQLRHRAFKVVKAPAKPAAKVADKS